MRAFFVKLTEVKTVNNQASLAMNKQEKQELFDTMIKTAYKLGAEVDPHEEGVSIHIGENIVGKGVKKDFKDLPEGVQKAMRAKKKQIMNNSK